MADKKSTKKSPPPRSNYYATTVYLESVNPQWLQILEDTHIQTFVSPYHDKDINPTGEPKKPHYHVLLMFDSLKSSNQAKEIFDSINGVGVEMVNSIRGYSRYLCHLDNPEKAQYEKEDVKCLSGADYITIIGLQTDKYVIMGEMQDFCEKYNIVSFYLLCKYARQKRSDWYRALCDNSSFYMKEYLKSKLWSNENDIQKIIDLETGEEIG
jgi:hypothetical protein